MNLSFFLSLFLIEIETHQAFNVIIIIVIIIIMLPCYMDYYSLCEWLERNYEQQLNKRDLTGNKCLMYHDHKNEIYQSINQPRQHIWAKMSRRMQLLKFNLKSWLLSSWICQQKLADLITAIPIPALACKPPGCGFKSTSYLCLWDLFP